MRFIHTADWQIGKVFKQFGAKEEVLRRARLDAIERIGSLAAKHGATHVLVAGDVYDSEAPNAVTLRAPIERIRQFPDLQWHLLPGNHDPHRPVGLWDRLLHLGLPAHVHVHLEARPVVLNDSAFLLPAPLFRKSEFDDLTAWMDAAPTPQGALRIGLAHGSIANFGNEGEATNPISPSRATKAGLDYLALGDWHRTMQVSPSIWYAGTPEPDRMGRQERGTALLVDVPCQGAPPTITHLTTGTFRWIARTERLSDGDDLFDLDKRLRNHEDLSHLVMRLQFEGVLPLSGLSELQRICTGLEAAVFHLETDRTALAARPTQADLEAIDFDGVLRRSADRLHMIAEDPAHGAEFRRRAEAALIELYLRINQPEELG